MGTISNNVKARVLNAVSAVDPIVTNATNRTANYELPLFVGSDKPAWLVDWNNTMVAIDLLLKEIESSGNDNTVAINQLETRMNEMDTVVAKAQSDILTNAQHIKDNADDIANLQKSVDVIQDDLVAQNTLVKQHTSQIADLQEKDTQIDGQITDLQDKDTQIDGQITDLQEKDAEIEESVSGVERRVSTNETNIQSLNTSVEQVDGKADTATTKADNAQTSANTADEKATTAIGLANEGISKANTAQNSADNAKNITNEYIRQHSNYQFTPGDNFGSVEIPLQSSSITSDSFTLTAKPITGDTEGVKKVYGLLTIASQNRGTPGILNAGMIPYIMPFYANFTTNEYYFVIPTGAKVQELEKLYIGEGADIYATHLTMNINADRNSIEFSVTRQSASTGEGIYAFLNGMLFV